jgi:ABC-type uncharacterized transport system ATPase subunit
VILITHKLREVMDITDAVSVMRAGTVVGNVRTADVDKEKLADLMVGRKVSLKVDKAERCPVQRCWMCVAEPDRCARRQAAGRAGFSGACR